MNTEMKLHLLISIGLIWIGIASCSRNQSGNHADLILINGKIWTANEPSSFVEALAIRGNTILEVGTSANILKLAGEKTRVVDLKGRLVGPGFNDAHIHFLSGSLGLSQIELSGSESIQEMLAKITDYVSNNPDLKWITGRGWQYHQFEGGLPSRQILDSVIKDRPILIKAYDGHSAWANSKALSLAGINRNTKFMGYGEIVFDAKGEPTGALKEGAQSLVTALIPQPTRTDKLNALLKGMKLAASLGITTIQNASGSAEEFSLYKELLKNNELTLRVAAAFSIDTETTEAEIDSFTNIKERIQMNPMIRAGSVKFMLDGVIESHTASMLEPYSDIPLNDPSSVGRLGWPLPHYRDLVARFDKLGFQIYTHAIGDNAVREALNAYENAMTINGTKPGHHRIEHIETISLDDIVRFYKLGVLASMEPIHADPATIKIWEDAIGLMRLPNSFAWASMLQNNVFLVFSSDWPACIDLNPIHGLHTAVNRRTIKGLPKDGWVPKQRIPIGKALSAYTLAGAYSSFEDNVKGKIAPGYLADLIVFSKDLFTMDPMNIHETQIMMTIFDGKIIYTNGLQ